MDEAGDVGTRASSKKHFILGGYFLSLDEEASVAEVRGCGRLGIVPLFYPMAHPLYGPFLKLKRADEHLRTLYDRVKAFIDGNPYGFAREKDPNPGDYLEVVLFRAKVHANPPIVEWGTIIGDVVHNLRSALDQLVWALTVQNRGPAPPLPLPRGSSWRQVQFPIVEEAKDFGAAASGSLWGVPSPLVAIFERIQPYHTGQSHRHPLWVLQELWNTDKHRFLPIIGTMTKLTRLDYISPLKAEVVLTRVGYGPFEDGAEIFRVNVIENPWEGEPEMDVYPESIFDVAFDQGAPAHGGPVVQTLHGLFEFVSAVLVHFNSYFS